CIGRDDEIGVEKNRVWSIRLQEAIPLGNINSLEIGIPEVNANACKLGHPHELRPAGVVWRPRTAAAGGRPQAGLEDVEKLLTSITSKSALAVGEATSRSSWISLGLASDVRDQGLA